MVESKATESAATKKNWAEEDDGEDGDDQTIGKTSTAQEEVKQVAQVEDAAPKKVYAPPPTMKRNKFGDFIVENVEVVIKEVAKLDTESEETESEEEEVVPQKEAEVVKAAPVKAISKKEQKRLEQEEFDRIMAEQAVNAEASPAEEQKQ